MLRATCKKLHVRVYTYFPNVWGLRQENCTNSPGKFKPSVNLVLAVEKSTNPTSDDEKQKRCQQIIDYCFGKGPFPPGIEHLPPKDHLTDTDIKEKYHIVTEEVEKDKNHGEGIVSPEDQPSVADKVNRHKAKGGVPKDGATADFVPAWQSPLNNHSNVPPQNVAVQTDVTRRCQTVDSEPIDLGPIMSGNKLPPDENRQPEPITTNQSSKIFKNQNPDKRDTSLDQTYSLHKKDFPLYHHSYYEIRKENSSQKNDTTNKADEDSFDDSSVIRATYASQDNTEELINKLEQIIEPPLVEADKADANRSNSLPKPLSHKETDIKCTKYCQNETKDDTNELINKLEPFIEPPLAEVEIAYNDRSTSPLIKCIKNSQSDAKEKIWRKNCNVNLDILIPLKEPEQQYSIYDAQSGTEKLKGNSSKEDNDPPPPGNQPFQLTTWCAMGTDKGKSPKDEKLKINIKKNSEREKRTGEEEIEIVRRNEEKPFIKTTVFEKNQEELQKAESMLAEKSRAFKDALLKTKGVSAEQQVQTIAKPKIVRAEIQVKSLQKGHNFKKFEIPKTQNVTESKPYARDKLFNISSLGRSEQEILLPITKKKDERKNKTYDGKLLGNLKEKQHSEQTQPEEITSLSKPELLRQEVSMKPQVPEDITIQRTELLSKLNEIQKEIKSKNALDKVILTQLETIRKEIENKLEELKKATVAKTSPTNIILQVDKPKSENELTNVAENALRSITTSKNVQIEYEEAKMSKEKKDKTLSSSKINIVDNETVEKLKNSWSQIDKNFLKKLRNLTDTLSLPQKEVKLSDLIPEHVKKQAEENSKRAYKSEPVDISYCFLENRKPEEENKEVSSKDTKTVSLSDLIPEEVKRRAEEAMQNPRKNLENTNEMQGMTFYPPVAGLDPPLHHQMSTYANNAKQNVEKYTSQKLYPNLQAYYDNQMQSQEMSTAVPWNLMENFREPPHLKPWGTPELSQQPQIMYPPLPTTEQTAASDDRKTTFATKTIQQLKETLIPKPQKTLLTDSKGSPQQLKQISDLYSNVTGHKLQQNKPHVILPTDAKQHTGQQHTIQSSKNTTTLDQQALQQLKQISDLYSNVTGHDLQRNKPHVILTTDAKQHTGQQHTIQPSNNTTLNQNVTSDVKQHSEQHNIKKQQKHSDMTSPLSFTTDAGQNTKPYNMIQPSQNTTASAQNVNANAMQYTKYYNMVQPSQNTTASPLNINADARRDTKPYNMIQPSQNTTASLQNVTTEAMQYTEQQNNYATSWPQNVTATKRQTRSSKHSPKKLQKKKSRKSRLSSFLPQSIRSISNFLTKETKQAETPSSSIADKVELNQIQEEKLQHTVKCGSHQKYCQSGEREHITLPIYDPCFKRRYQNVHVNTPTRNFQNSGEREHITLPIYDPCFKGRYQNVHVNTPTRNFPNPHKYLYYPLAEINYYRNMRAQAFRTRHYHPPFYRNHHAMPFNFRDPAAELHAKHDYSQIHSLDHKNTYWKSWNTHSKKNSPFTKLGMTHMQLFHHSWGPWPPNDQYYHNLPMSEPLTHVIPAQNQSGLPIALYERIQQYYYDKELNEGADNSGQHFFKDDKPNVSVEQNRQSIQIGNPNMLVQQDQQHQSLVEYNQHYEPTALVHDNQQHKPTVMAEQNEPTVSVDQNQQSEPTVPVEQQYSPGEPFRSVNQMPTPSAQQQTNLWLPPQSASNDHMIQNRYFGIYKTELLGPSKSTTPKQISGWLDNETVQGVNMQVSEKKGKTILEYGKTRLDNHTLKQRPSKSISSKVTQKDKGVNIQVSERKGNTIVTDFTTKQFVCSNIVEEDKDSKTLEKFSYELLSSIDQIISSKIDSNAGEIKMDPVPGYKITDEMPLSDVMKLVRMRNRFLTIKQLVDDVNISPKDPHSSEKKDSDPPQGSSNNGSSSEKGLKTNLKREEREPRTTSNPDLSDKCVAVEASENKEHILHSPRNTDHLNSLVLGNENKIPKTMLPVIFSSKQSMAVEDYENIKRVIVLEEPGYTNDQLWAPGCSVS